MHVRQTYRFWVVGAYHVALHEACSFIVGVHRFRASRYSTSVQFANSYLSRFGERMRKKLFELREGVEEQTMIGVSVGVSHLFVVRAADLSESNINACCKLRS
jgi:hypothetical protein